MVSLLALARSITLLKHANMALSACSWAHWRTGMWCSGAGCFREGEGIGGLPGEELRLGDAATVGEELATDVLSDGRGPVQVQRQT